MAKQSKNDQSIRNLLLKSGTVNQGVAPASYTRKDPKASMQAAIAARRQEFQRVSAH